ncbi:DUF4259 domain-containing protein [Paenibacillus silvae]|uniref:DUF4259 domain-containing protein n=1 Tax=Paenibacillus silvae TaxID=1325358 RepID=UPI002006BB9C|nr:DUF4259 domain-containing protein [Paenibacillus silvae]MCK6074697.1 DUF4259 domain-containing protein [Paenibacillus silvae]MCK6147828.1 DUF4259 domain-containing protein [Paenibacillus silvae]MCK6266126.1 DUF4259 domain-containing protein [Paenibacillus silvae]
MKRALKHNDTYWRLIDGKKLISKAKRAVKKIKKDSELKELWEESEEYPIWLNTINDLENRL